MGLRDINPNDERLTANEGAAFSIALQKFEGYSQQGRGHDAHGAGMILRIFWDVLISEDFSATQLTGWDEL